MWLEYKQNYCVLDFETKSGKDITSSSLMDYISDPDFEVLCLAAKFKDCEPIILDNSNAIRDFCKKLFQANIPIVAHNAVFDFFVFHKVIKCKFKELKRFIPTELLSVYVGGPSSLKLEDCGIFWNLKEAKDTRGKILINALCLPFTDKTPLKFEEYKIKEPKLKKGFLKDDFMFQKLKEYCVQDVRTTDNLFCKLSYSVPELVKHKIDQDFYYNAIRNFKGLEIDQNLVKLLKEQTEKLKIKIFEASKKLTEDKDFNLNSSQQVIKFINNLVEEKYQVSSIRKENLITYLGHYKKMPEKVKNMINLRLSVPKGVSKKLENMCVPKITDCFITCGTGQTRRFTSFGVNPLNFPRSGNLDLKKNITLMKEDKFISEFKTNAYSELKKMFRNCIVARDVFYGCDFSQIEFRLLMLASGEQKVLEKIFSGWDPYVHLAQRIYQKQEISKSERYVAKRGTLAFGYGLSAIALFRLLLGENIEVSLPYLEKTRELYHIMYPRVKNFWNKAITKFALNKGKSLHVPFSNRIMYFPETRYFDRNWQLRHPKSGSYNKINGGSFLTGYCIQGLAADVFNYKIRELKKELNMDVSLPFHDEVLVDRDFKNIEFKDFQKIMQRTPRFLPQDKFPYLDCDFWQGRRYLKT